MSNKDIKPVNNKGQAHGYWERYWGNGELLYKCVYNKGKEIGYEEYYDYNDSKLTFIKRYYL